MYTDPQDTIKVIKVHDLPHTQQPSANTKYKSPFVPNRLNICLSLLLDNKKCHFNVIPAKGNRYMYSIERH